MTGKKALQLSNSIYCKKNTDTAAISESIPIKTLFLDAIQDIRMCRFESALSVLKRAVCAEIENPESYNLMGILYEKEGNRQKASKFYRVAYYMDQTFVAAAENLDRICGFWYNDRNVQWGIDLPEVNVK